MPLASLAVIALGLSVPQAEKPSVLLGRSLAHYAGARTVQGQIHFIQSAADHSISAVTEVAIERPNKMRLRQIDESHAKSSLLTSDGLTYAYDGPTTALGGASVRLVDGAVRRTEPLPLSEMFRSARPSLLDKYSPYFEVLTGELPELKRLKNGWATVEDGGDDIVGARACRIVKGQRRPDPRTGGSGTYRIWISPEGDMLQYETREKFDIGQNGEVAKNLLVVTRWTADLTVDAPIPTATFKVVP